MVTLCKVHSYLIMVSSEKLLGGGRMAKANSQEFLESLKFTPEELKSLAAYTPAKEPDQTLFGLDLADGLILLWVLVMSIVYYLCAKSRLLLAGKVHPSNYDYHIAKNTGTFFRWVLPFIAIAGIVIGLVINSSWWINLFLVVCVVFSRIRGRRYP